jgi:small subunit ribosomal protein S2
MSISIREMLEAGVHFGHKTSRWNPKMRPYIYGARNGIHIIDLQKSARLFRHAYGVIREAVSSGQSVLFVGTKKQAQEVISEEAARGQQFYVTNRWLGGTLTNFVTIKKSIKRLNELEEMFEDGSIQNRGKKERLMLEKEMVRLKKNLGGIQQMKRLPGLMFVVDPVKDKIAVSEAVRLGIPVVAIVDSNSDPTHVDFPIPGNDDAIRSVRLLSSIVANACLEGLAAQKERPQPEQKERRKKRDRKDNRADGPKLNVEVRPSTDADEAPAAEAPAAPAAEAPAETAEA